MRVAANFQMLVCLMVYVSSVHSIMVKYGTKDGPIEPPQPEPLPSPQPYRKPAPVWEERNNDTPDPNAHWRPPAFVPQRRYTNIVYKSPATAAPVPLNSAQRFVSAYKPENKPVTDLEYRRPTVLSSQTLPGIGLRYFYPAEKVKQQKPTKQEDSKLNHIDSEVEKSSDSDHEIEWKYEKESTRRAIRNNREATAGAPGLITYHVYQWPIYVQPRHH